MEANEAVKGSSKKRLTVKTVLDLIKPNELVSYDELTARLGYKSSTSIKGLKRMFRSEGEDIEDYRVAARDPKNPDARTLLYIGLKKTIADTKKRWEKE